MWQLLMPQLSPHVSSYYVACLLMYLNNTCIYMYFLYYKYFLLIIWDTDRDDESKVAYNTARKQAKREVAKARNVAYEKLYQRLEMNEGVK